VSTSKSSSSPTARQLRYLRTLAVQTGTSFITPSTRAQASAEIERMVKLKAGPNLQLPEAHIEPELYGTAVRDDEVSGHGVSARWAGNAAEPGAASVRTLPPIGPRTELGRYRVSAGEQRVLYGQRINGRVRLTDRPADGSGRSYLVESGLEVDGFEALKTLVVDYIEQAGELDRVPMSMSALRSRSEYLADA
jgi:hypothetical protein